MSSKIDDIVDEDDKMGIESQKRNRIELTGDERMQIVLGVLIFTIVVALSLYSYLYFLASSPIPKGFRSHTSLSSPIVVFGKVFSLFNYVRSRLLSITLPSATSAPYIWSRKKSRKSASARALDGDVDGEASEDEDIGSLLGLKSASSSAHHVKLQVFRNGEWNNPVIISLNKAECFKSTQDLGEIVCPKVGLGFLAGIDKGCSLFSAYGTRVTSCSDLKPEEDSVFVVPQGRLFMLPSTGVGYRMEIHHIDMPTHLPIVVETLSLQPRIFRLVNFFSSEEADMLVHNALTIEEESHRLKRSSTGATGYTVDNKRTSEGAFDTSSDVAMRIKRRSFDMLGIFPFDESFSDGLQVLRYNLSTAYDTHMDWIGTHSVGTEATDHDYDSAGEGTNRYATIILYLSDVEAGGETVFPDREPLPAAVEELPVPQTLCDGASGVCDANSTAAAPNDSELSAIKDPDAATTAYLEALNVSDLFLEGSWQRKMITQCRTRLAVKPKRLEAILFYSQFPDGQPDYSSKHGGCPVLQGQKWAANLWVWNGPRNGYWKKNTLTGKNEKPVAQSVSASFESKDVLGARLYWEDQLWEELSPGRPIKVNTFSGHKWNVKIDNDLLVSWVIEDGKPSQRFILSSEDLPTYS
mmetsp:Transcript_14450/g.19826  ORF Transcript_14450/g.19826 Transcript_14450/m.19826 type:complete len:637 (+) Transcript_14450:1-1911(+)